jgi:hypothetical protein
MVVCHHCGKTADTGERVGRGESCPHCGWDLHVCLNCQHYDLKAYNECHETQADRVLDKEKSNFCDFFAPLAVARSVAVSKNDEVKAKLEAMFKKPK